MRVTAAEGDITAFDVDVIVNAANNRMRGGGGVDGAIHRAGGPTILEDCIARFPNGLPTGEAGWTTAGDLSARWVVHVVGPIHGLGERRQLVSCYRHAMSVADELGAKTSRSLSSAPASTAGRLKMRSMRPSKASWPSTPQSSMFISCRWALIDMLPLRLPSKPASIDSKRSAAHPQHLIESTTLAGVDSQTPCGLDRYPTPGVVALELLLRPPGGGVVRALACIRRTIDCQK